MGELYAECPPISPVGHTLLPLGEDGYVNIGAVAWQTGLGKIRDSGYQEAPKAIFDHKNKIFCAAGSNILGGT